jgi:hypothetical protein
MCLLAMLFSLIIRNGYPVMYFVLLLTSRHGLVAPAFLKVVLNAMTVTWRGGAHGLNDSGIHIYHPDASFACASVSV